MKNRVALLGGTVTVAWEDGAEGKVYMGDVCIFEVPHSGPCDATIFFVNPHNRRRKKMKNRDHARQKRAEKRRRSARRRAERRAQGHAPPRNTSLYERDMAALALMDLVSPSNLRLGGNHPPFL